MTLFEPCDYLFKLVSRRRTLRHRAVRYEADLQAPQPEAGQQAWISRAHEDAWRSRRPLAPTEEGSRTSRRHGGRQVGSPAPGSGEGLPRSVRIRRTKEIRALLDRGKRKRTRMVDVFLAPSPGPFSRLGLVVPKHGHGIVERNRLKRRLRELGRRRVLPGLRARAEAADVLIRARGAAYGASFEELTREVVAAVEALCSDVS